MLVCEIHTSKHHRQLATGKILPGKPQSRGQERVSKQGRTGSASKRGVTDRYTHLQLEMMTSRETFSWRATELKVPGCELRNRSAPVKSLLPPWRLDVEAAPCPAAVSLACHSVHWLTSNDTHTHAHCQLDVTWPADTCYFLTWAVPRPRSVAYNRRRSFYRSM